MDRCRGYCEKYGNSRIVCLPSELGRYQRDETDVVYPWHSSRYGGIDLKAKEGRMMGFLLGLWGKAKLYIIAAAMAILAILTYGQVKKREGKNEVRSQDRKYITEAGNDKRDRDRRLRADPISTPDRRERLRRERDELRELLRSE